MQVPVGHSAALLHFLSFCNHHYFIEVIKWIITELNYPHLWKKQKVSVVVSALAVYTPWAIKTEPTYFCLKLREKSIDINAVFNVRINDERYMWRYELHPPHLINVATLSCESRNSGILPKKIASSVLYMLHWNGPVKNAWRKFGLTLNRTLSRLRVRLTSGASVSDHVCVLVVDSLNICCEIHVFCIMWFIRTFYETVNVIWCIRRPFRS